MDPVVGWRVWDCLVEDGLLRSVFQDDVWPAGERFEARCRRQAAIYIAGRECSTAPRAACCCGIYAAHNQDDLSSFSRYEKTWGTRNQAVEVVGTVSLWGHIIQHEAGWRAQYAYPYALWVKPPRHGTHSRDVVELMCSEVAAKLRDTYTVDVGVLR